MTQNVLHRGVGIRPSTTPVPEPLTYAACTTCSGLLLPVAGGGLRRWRHDITCCSGCYELDWSGRLACGTNTGHLGLMDAAGLHWCGDDTQARPATCRTRGCGTVLDVETAVNAVVWSLCEPCQHEADHCE